VPDTEGTADLLAAAVGDELAEAVGPAVGDRADQVVVAGDAGDHVVLLSRLGFGEADPAIFGAGEAAAGNHAVRGLPGRSRIAFVAAMRPSIRAVWTSIERPLTSPAAKMCSTLVRRKSSTESAPGPASTPAASRFSWPRLAGQPTAKNTASATIRPGPARPR
jgi:hypothetical protein